MFEKRYPKRLAVKISDSYSDLSKAIDASQHGIAFVIDEENLLLGVVTSGDLRRGQQDKHWTNSVNYKPRKLINYIITDEDKYFSESKATCLPVVDSFGKLVGLYASKKRGFDVNGTRIGNDTECFIIAEIGNNHNGSVEEAYRLVDLAKEAGADCVKFQLRDLPSLYINNGDPDDPSADLSSQYVLGLLRKYQLADKELFSVMNYAVEIGLVPLCTPFDIVSLKKLVNHGFETVKISSSDFTNLPLLTAVCEHNLNAIISTGMTTQTEINEITTTLDDLGLDYALLHCNSSYPTPFVDVNLSFMRTLKAKDRIIGYSGHERGYEVPIAAVSLGAKIIEKHFTLNKSLEGNDHKVSLLPHEFESMVTSIRNVEAALGSGASRTLTQGEMINRQTLSKSLVVNRDMDVGEILGETDVVAKAPGTGIPPNKLPLFVNQRLTKPKTKDSILFASDFQKESVTVAPKIGEILALIPVRFHDFYAMKTAFQVDGFEFHLSAADLHLASNNFLGAEKCETLVVHAPELFEAEHLLDLASDDTRYRKESISHLNRTYDKAEEIANSLNYKGEISIIINAGGFTNTKHMDRAWKYEKYALVEDALASIDREKILPLIQTMPPFPWHFGGQSFHNLFRDPSEISQFCASNNRYICLDTSHSYLEVNFTKTDWAIFLDQVLKFTKHLHLADAKGIADEGLQIGDGEINWLETIRKIKHFNNITSYIPEIWQGHVDNAAGFKTAFEVLQHVE